MPDGRKHLNCLVRASAQFRWKKIVEMLFEEYKVSVSYGSNVKTWSEGVIYGRVANEHKKPEMLDQSPEQWARNGSTMKFEDSIPRKWQAQGFTRQTGMTPLAFLDLMRDNAVKSESEAWALANALEEKGDRGLMGYMMANDVPAMMEKVSKATSAKATVERSRMTRMQILENFAANGLCVCAEEGLCYELMKNILRKNGIDGVFQRAVVETMTIGRLKMRN